MSYQSENLSSEIVYIMAAVEKKFVNFSRENSDCGDRATPTSLPRDESSSEELGCEITEGLVGAQFAEKQSFKSKNGQQQLDLIPLIIDFKKLFSGSQSEVLTGVSDIPKAEFHCIVTDILSDCQ